MRVSRGLGLAGISAAVGAVALIPAAASAGTTYNSTATATAGSVTIAGNNVPVPDNSVTATNQTGPQAASLGASALESALGSSAGPLVSSMKATLPNGADLLTETATASADGKSAACAGFLLAGDCTPTGKAQPLTLSLSLADLPGLPTGGTSSGTNQPQTTPQKQSPNLLPTSNVPDPLKSAAAKLGGAVGSAVPGNTSTAKPASAANSSSTTPNPLAGFALVLTLEGPEATCTAGPPGSAGSNFTATQSLASASVDIQQNGQSILPGGPIALKSGDILNQLPSSLPAPLTSALSQLNISSLTQANPLDLTIDTGSTSGAGAGPSTTATAGELGIGVNGMQILDLKAAQAKCGPNKAVAGATKPATKTTSSEQPLGGGIQTDEGRSGSGSDPALWAGVAGAAVVGGTASGLTLWRRRRNAL